MSIRKALLPVLGVLGFQPGANAEDLSCAKNEAELVRLIEIGGRAFAKLPKAIAEFSDSEYACAVFNSGDNNEGKFADYACRSSSGQQLGLRVFQDSRTGLSTLSLYRAPSNPSKRAPLVPFFEAQCGPL